MKTCYNFIGFTRPVAGNPLRLEKKSQIGTKIIVLYIYALVNACTLWIFWPREMWNRWSRSVFVSLSVHFRCGCHEWSSVSVYFPRNILPQLHSRYTPEDSPLTVPSIKMGYYGLEKWIHIRRPLWGTSTVASTVSGAADRGGPHGSEWTQQAPVSSRRDIHSPGLCHFKY